MSSSFNRSSFNRIRLVVGLGSVVAWVLPAMAQRAVQPLRPVEHDTAIPVPDGRVPAGQPYYGQGGYYAGQGYYPGQGYYSFNSRRTQERSFGIGRRTERYRQNAIEAERRLNEYRYRRGLAVPQPYGYGRPNEAPPQVYGSDWDSFYSYGRDLERYRQREFSAREQLTLYTQQDYLQRGLGEFRAGDYGAAARSFLAATNLDQGDSASRIHAGQALVATGLYDQAAKQFRRGFELRIRLLNTPLNLQADYGRKEDYFQHVEKLESFCRSHPEDGSAWLCLAFERFFGPTPSSAAEAMRKVKRLWPKDALAERLLQAAEPILRSNAPSKNKANVKRSRSKT